MVQSILFPPQVTYNLCKKREYLSRSLIYVECHLTQSGKRSLTIFQPSSYRQRRRTVLLGAPALLSQWFSICPPIPYSFHRLAPFVNASFNFSILFIENETAQNLHKNCVYPTCQFFFSYSHSRSIHHPPPSGFRPKPNQSKLGPGLDAEPFQPGLLLLLLLLVLMMKFDSNVYDGLLVGHIVRGAYISGT